VSFLAITEHDCRDLRPGNETLNHDRHPVGVDQFVGARFGLGVGLLHRLVVNAYTAAALVELDNQRQPQILTESRAPAGEKLERRRGDIVGVQQLLGQIAVVADDETAHARAAVGNASEFQGARDGCLQRVTAAQRIHQIQHEIRLVNQQLGHEVPIGAIRLGPDAQLLQRRHHFFGALLDLDLGLIRFPGRKPGALDVRVGHRHQPQGLQRRLVNGKGPRLVVFSHLALYRTFSYYLRPRGLLIANRRLHLFSRPDYTTGSPPPGTSRRGSLAHPLLADGAIVG
jgi:hypothetical protein